MSSAELIKIDGGYLEGGGQIEKYIGRTYVFLIFQNRPQRKRESNLGQFLYFFKAWSTNRIASFLSVSGKSLNLPYFPNSNCVFIPLASSGFK